MKIAIGTQNAPKLRAVQTAFEKLFPNDAIEVVGARVTSGVADHPVGTKKIIHGARNRAKAAMLMVPDADYSVGIEGGLSLVLESERDEWHEQCWVVIHHRGEEGKARGVSIPVSRQVARGILSGSDLNREVEKLTGTHRIGDAGGYIGMATNGALLRDESYAPAVLAAMARFLNPELF